MAKTCNRFFILPTYITLKFRVSIQNMGSIRIHRCVWRRQRLQTAGLPDGIVQTKNPYLGTFRRVLQWKLLVYFRDIVYILQPFGIFYGHYIGTFCGNLVYFFPVLGMLYQEKSGNPASEAYAVILSEDQY
jgi:hypothetical protein